MTSPKEPLETDGGTSKEPPSSAPHIAATMYQDLLSAQPKRSERGDGRRDD